MEILIKSSVISYNKNASSSSINIRYCKLLVRGTEIYFCSNEKISMPNLMRQSRDPDL